MYYGDVINKSNMDKADTYKIQLSYDHDYSIVIKELHW